MLLLWCAASLTTSRGGFPRDCDVLLTSLFLQLLVAGCPSTASWAGRATLSKVLAFDLLLSDDDVSRAPRAVQVCVAPRPRGFCRRRELCVNSTFAARASGSSTGEAITPLAERYSSGSPFYQKKTASILVNIHRFRNLGKLTSRRVQNAKKSMKSHMISIDLAK